VGLTPEVGQERMNERVGEEKRWQAREL